MIYLQLFYEFFLIGLFTFGGGYAMIPLVRETVIRNEWITESMFFDLIGVCESTPGPIAINMATFVGSTQGGFFGSVCATLGVVMPSFIIIVLVASILTKFMKNKYFQAFLKGAKPVIVGLILSAGAVLLLKNFGFVDKTQFDFNLPCLIMSIILAIIMFGYKKITKKNLNTILFIVIAGVLGVIVGFIL